MAATQDEALIETALRMALLGRQPPAGVLFHSDRGSQYTSDAYRAALAQADMTVSMSRTGNCYDNAVTESFIKLRQIYNTGASSVCFPRKKYSDPL